jgi:hypothetical protein
VSWFLLLVSVASLVTGSLQPAVAGEPIPSIRLFAASSKLVVHRYGNTVWVAPSVWVASTDGGFELWVSRPNYDTPIDLTQVATGTGTVVRDLPEDVLQGLFGLEDFFRMTVRDKDGHLVSSMNREFCPNEGERQRVNDQGPVNPMYPWLCGGSHPLVLGTVWGIEDGWAVNALGWDGAVPLHLPVGHYTLKFWIKNPYPAMFDIAAEDASATMDLYVMKPESGTAAPRAAGPEAEGGGALVEGVPDDTTPDPSTLPDLVAMPAWGIGTVHRTTGDFLTFGATEWNRGPARMVVEGFREPGTNVMDAFQYFYDGDSPVGRAPVGTMIYHGGTHQHWHFQQFTEYSLLDATKSEVVLSKKQSWCLAPTDAIDLTVEGATWLPGSFGFTACGSKGSIWVREVLDVGWGDTYFQFMSGQAFNITGLPNGTYFIQVHVNPLGALYETDTGNDVELREIRLWGQPGHRRVVVRPWHGIDTESGIGFGGPVPIP